MKHLVISILFVMLCAGSWVWAEGAKSILSNGNFQTDGNADGWPDDWPKSNGATWEKEVDGNRFIRMEAQGADTMGTLYRSVAVPAGCEAMELTCRVRATEVVTGEEKWNDARIIMHFKDKDKKELYPEPRPIAYRGSTDGWVKVSVRFKAPAGAASFEFIPAMFKCQSGTFDLDDVAAAPIDPKKVGQKPAQ